MWIYLNDAFLSIVQNYSNPALLHVRSRHPGDIERLFPGAEVKHTPGGDYHFRTDLDRETVAEVLAARIASIDYTNFKNSISDSDRHDVYFDVWSATQHLQRR